MKDDNKKSIDKVLEEQTDFLLSINGVLGVAVGKTDNDQTCISVQVDQLTDENFRKIPKEIDGYIVSILETDQPTPF